MTYRVCITCYEACELSLIFSILHVVVLEKLWTFELGKKQSVRITSEQIHSFGSRIHLVHFNVCRKPGPAEPETLKLGCELKIRNEPSCRSMLAHGCLDLQVDVLKLKF